MPEPILATAIVAGYALLQPLARGTSAFSSSARQVSEIACAVLDDLETPVSLFGAQSSSITALSEAAAEACVEDWDGYGGLPANPMAVDNAAAFIRSLPLDMMQPEVAVDPDGQISLEWFGAKDRIFSISFSDRGRVAYAGIDGTDRWRGAEMFDGNSIHPFLLMGIRRVIS
jgi:hypothetical protein